ncbi:MAG: NAD-glutamate dehydrogenase domain-containing protein [Acidimicrobiales bacterium]
MTAQDEELAPPPEGLPGPGLAAILANLNASPEHGPVPGAFARAVLRRVPEHDLEHTDTSEITVAVLDAFRFVDSRPAGKIGVRLTDPPVILDGGVPTGSVLEVSCDDRQFIVTTVREELHRLGQRIVRLHHPVFGSERGPDGALVAVLPARTAPLRESFLQVELASRVAPGARPAVVEAVRRVLLDVAAATDDHLAMQSAVSHAIERLRRRAALRYPTDEVDEAAELLEWLLDDNFVLLGTCRLPASADALGTLARRATPLRRIPADPDNGGHVLRIAATPEVSTVHRQVAIHRIDVADVDPDGSLAGVFRIAGVFSWNANAAPATLTPVLRFKLRRILELEDVVEGSHDEATLVSLFQVLPKEELFEADIATLRRVLVDLLAAEDHHDVRVLLRPEPATRTISALLSVPQDLYTPTLRHRLERFLLAQLDGTRVETQVSLGDRADAVVRIVVHVDGPLPDEPLDALGREVRLLCRTWDQELTAALESRVGERQAAHLVRTWAEWFPAGYRDAFPAAHAVDDVLELDRIAAAGWGASERPADGLRVALTPDRGAPGNARLKVFSVGTAVALSRFLPIIESLGLWAVEEQPNVLGSGAHRVHLHDFRVSDPSGAPLDVESVGARLAEAAQALWHGRAEVDSLNRLVLHAGLSWQDVVLLRAYHRYRNQVGAGFTTANVADVLVANATVARALVDLFVARFDPSPGVAPEVVAELRQRVVAGCDAVVRLDHDRILRGFLALVEATLRTNRYVAGGPHLALKFDSARVPDVPRPVPYREVFVYGPSVEGIHLRWGPVARGGIRWSERPDDYRSEVLGLMRTQVQKNALIVPTGAKGGFIVKRGRYGTGVAANVPRAYEIFIRCLLEVTDNLVGDTVVPVPGRRDGDDPYLVVAADRGTNGLSDRANAVSRELGFWLGDAFASGGSHGYDHKRLGITARGAWVAVRHHLAQLGIDADTERLTVAGIGDMSGDVFGNGMLRTARLRLVAAFDHRDIFLDPNPDPAASHAERARLFALPSSSWQDYDPALISPGGGVWSRLVKKVELSDQARAALGVEHLELTPAELIQAILGAPVDLLFAGGIGTFVRASTEPDRDLDDRANTDVRIPASRLRARVVGEGANLAFTQRARIEFARGGGRVNTDAIDNSAGVDISDREVNIKILLRTAVDAGELTPDERDALLEAVCEEVVEDVLEDCRDQSFALSRRAAASPGLMDAAEALMVELEAGGVLDRSVEALPTTEEMRARRDAQQGLTRPELAVLLAGAKRSLTAQLLRSAVPDQPGLRALLVAYFPAVLAVRFDHLLDRHNLRRELIASEMANDVVNRMGPTFVKRVATDSGAGGAEIASAYWIARGVSGAADRWQRLDGDETLPWGGAALDAARAATALLEALARSYLRRGEAADIAPTIARDRPAFLALAAAMPEIGTANRRQRRELLAESLVARGVETVLALEWVTLPELALTPDVADLSRSTGRSVVEVAGAFLGVGEHFGIDRLVDQLGRVPAGDRWSQAAWRGALNDLDDLRRVGARLVLAAGRDGDTGGAVADALALIADIEREPEARIDALAVATRAVRRALSS